MVSLGNIFSFNSQVFFEEFVFAFIFLEIIKVLLLDEYQLTAGL